MRAFCLSAVFLTFSALSPALAAAETCLTGDFNAFIDRYSREIALQEAATADPVIFEQIDIGTGDEPDLIAREMPLSEISWPVMPSLKAAEGMGYVVEMETAPGTGSVLMRGRDNGERMIWHFTESPCWTLVRIRDDGM